MSIPTQQTPRRRPPTAAEINARQKREAEELLAKRKAAPPASNGNTIAPATAVTLPDNRTEPEKYADEVAPSSIVGRLVKFNKDGVFVTSDDGEPIAEDREFFALVGDLQLGWIKFGAEGEPPTRIAGLLYHGFKLPKRAELGDDDPEQWPIGLSGAPTDPWLHQQNLVLQDCADGQMFTFSTTSKVGRTGVGNLVHHYNRMLRRNPDEVPIVRLRAGGFNHKDPRVGWVPTPVFAVVGKAPRDSATRPDTSLKADLDDEVPFKL